MDYVRYPFSAIVGQDEMKSALILNAINPTIGGVLIQGEKGTAKTTAVRALPSIFPDEKRVIELPLNASEDRVVGTVQIDALMKEGQRKFEPGLLAEADNNVMFVDEINLLDDSLVDVLLDAAATGQCHVERDGISYSHPARFVLVGTMNPEEGTLRPQLLDRFGLSVTVGATLEPSERAVVIRRRLAFEKNPQAFCAQWCDEESLLREKIARAIEILPRVDVSDELVEYCAGLCATLGVDGYRGDLTVMKTACTLAAFDNRLVPTEEDVQYAAQLALPHRMKRRPFEDRTLTPEMIRQAAQSISDSPEDDPSQCQAPEQLSSQEDQTAEAAEKDVSVAEDGVFVSLDCSVPGGEAMPSRGKKSASINAQQGHCTGSTTDSSSGKPHFLGSVISQLNSGESLKSGISSENLRFQKRAGKSGSKILFIVDSSGSMFSNRKLGAVKGCVMELLKSAYQSRDQIALIGYGGKHPQLYLSYTSSPELAAEQLRHMKCGGGTPLVEGLEMGMEFIEKNGASQVLLFSDGKYNRKGIDRAEERISAFGEYCATKDVQLAIIDAASGEVAGGEQGARLAQLLHGRYVPLMRNDNEALFNAVRGEIA